MTATDQPRIDEEALRAGLRAAGMDPAFTGCELAYIGRFSNDVWRLDLDNGVKLIVKKPYRTARPDENPQVERRFYQLMANRPGLPIPRFVADFDGALVLEYRRPEGFSFRTGAEPAHARAAVDALADWHAMFWNEPPTVSWLPDMADPRVRGVIQRNYDAAWRQHGERLLAHAPEFAGIGAALVGRLSRTLEPLARPATLTHGDAHAENVPITGEGAWLLDWQDPRIASPGLDLAVFMTMSFTEEGRARTEHELLARYARRLAAHGCDWPDVWHGYRLGVLRRAARIVEIAGDDFDSLPWVFRRSAMAAVQHGVQDLIR